MRTTVWSETVAVSPAGRGWLAGERFLVSGVVGERDLDGDALALVFRDDSVSWAGGVRYGGAVGQPLVGVGNIVETVGVGDVSSM